MSLFSLLARFSASARVNAADRCVDTRLSAVPEAGARDSTESTHEGRGRRAGGPLVWMRRAMKLLHHARILVRGRALRLAAALTVAALALVFDAGAARAGTYTVYACGGPAGAANNLF